jgi:hypothetical protein
MNTPRFAPLLVPLLLCLLALVGCVSSPPPDGYEINPFGRGCHCPDCGCAPGQCPGQCPDGVCPPDQCPGGQCPAPTSQSSGTFGGVEIGGFPAAPVDSISQSETKTGPPCPTCPNVSPSSVSPFGTVTPATITPRPARPQPPQATPKTSPLDEPKTGNFACQACKRTTVGQAWRELWTDDGRSILAICRDCDATLAPEAREAVLRRYLTASGIDVDRDPSMHAAVMAATRAR